MKRIPPIKSVMTPFPYSIDINENVHSALEMMGERDIHHLPVTDKGHLVGMISDRGIKRALDPEFGLPPDKKHKIRYVANLEAYVVDLTEPLDNVVLDMARKHIGSALVVSEGRLVGVFTATDACKYLGEFLRAFFPRGEDDAA